MVLGGCFHLRDKANATNHLAMSRKGRLKPRSAFTLVELLIVIVILAVLAAIAIPRFMNSGQRSKDASLKSDLQLVRNAVQLFQIDNGAYPASLDALTNSSAPASGLDAAGAAKTIHASDWKGPYLQSAPSDPVSGGALKYGTDAGSVGLVSSTASGNDADGNPYSGY